MKKYNIIAMLLVLLGLFTGCKEEDITLTSELPQFELRDGYMLLEVIVPYGTGINDQIYIYGDFNGGEDAIGDARWLLQRGNPASGVPAKFGIYINPNDFVNGKTLADGYTFYNIQSGPERSVDNEPVYHKEYPAAGQRLNVFVDYWESDFLTPENPDDVTHDGYAIYILNNSSWKDLYLWAWDDDGNIMGDDASWPGLAATGMMNINGTTYTYFDTGAANEGRTVNIIISDNGSPQTPSPDPVITLNKDYYFELTADGALVEIDPDASVEHNGYAIFVYNATDWTDLYIWVWEEGKGGEDFLGVGWPGDPFTGTQTVNGVPYSYYDFGTEHTGMTVNVIVSNNGSPQTSDLGGLTLDKDYYFELSGTTLTAIDPDTFTPGGATDTPVVPEDPVPGNTYNLYVKNSAGWSSMYVYAWDGGGDSIFGAWPGVTSSETRVINGETYLVYEMNATNTEVNLIFNNNDGVQTENLPIIVNQDYYVNVTATEATLLPYPTFKIYAENQTGWSSLYLYGWGDAGNSFFGDWPGKPADSQETVNGVTYSVFTFEGNGMSENLIFNNNDGSQTPDYPVTLNKDYYLTVTPDGAQEK